MNLKTINRVLASIIVIANFYFIPITYNIIKSNGGGFGLGLLFFPFSITINLLLLTSIPIFFK